jgi:hypothetical protein
MSKLLKYWKVISLGAVVTAMGLFMASCVETEDDEKDGAGTYTVRIVGGGAGSNVTDYNDKPTTTFKAGDTVVIFAGSTPSGKTDFDKWTIAPSSTQLYDANDRKTTFIMPRSNVTVTANWVSGSVSTFSVALDA